MIPRAIFNCDNLFIKDEAGLCTLTKIVQTKIPYSIIDYNNDHVNDFFNKIIIDGYSQEDELPKVASISGTLAKKLEKIHQGINKLNIYTIVNTNMASNLELLTSICCNLIINQMTDLFIW